MASHTHKWFNGKIIGYDHTAGTHSVYFESDGQTLAVNVSQEDDIIFYN